MEAGALNYQMSNWSPSSKYEVAPGLFIGSEIGDIDREIKVLMKAWLDGDATARIKILELLHRREQLLKSKRLNE